MYSIKKKNWQNNVITAWHVPLTGLYVFDLLQISTRYNPSSLCYLITVRHHTNSYRKTVISSCCYDKKHSYTWKSDTKNAL